MNLLGFFAGFFSFLTIMLMAINVIEGMVM